MVGAASSVGNGDAVKEPDIPPSRRSLLSSTGGLHGQGLADTTVDEGGRPVPHRDAGAGAPPLAADPMGWVWVLIFEPLSHSSGGLGGFAAAGYAATTMVTLVASGLAVRVASRWAGGSGEACAASL